MEHVGKSVTKIALTGGPCAGKTTAASWIAEEFSKLGYHVMFVPESATELIVGGILLTDFPVEDFQRMNIRNQLHKERLFEEAARLHPSDKVLIVCDRGLMDNEAYMGADAFARLLTGMELDRVRLRDDYDAVLHLVTAADGAEKAYTLSNNGARWESPEQARAVDGRLLQAWTGHPHLRVIGNDGTFEHKMRRVIREIAAVLGEPEPKEIERKFLIRRPTDEWLSSCAGHDSVDIIQTYLSCDEPRTERRIRQRGRDGSYTYMLTTKKDVEGTTEERVELERIISEREYLALMMESDTSKAQIRKTRHLVVSHGQYLEIDVYPFDDERAILEVELDDADTPVIIPDGIEVIAEVTDDRRYRNASLAGMLEKTLDLGVA